MIGFGVQKNKHRHFDLLFGSLCESGNRRNRLWLTCSNGNTEIIKFLLDYSIENNILFDMSKNGSLLFISCLCNRIVIVKYLLEYCEKYRFHVHGDTIILIAVKYGFNESLIMLL